MYKLLSKKEAEDLNDAGFISVEIPDVDYSRLFGAHVDIAYKKYSYKSTVESNIFRCRITGSDHGGIAIVNDIILHKDFLAEDPDKGMVFELLDMTVKELIDVAKLNYQDGIIIGCSMPMFADVLLMNEFEIMPKSVRDTLNRGIKEWKNEKEIGKCMML